MSKEYSKKKSDGATFTPDLLASFLAERILLYYSITDHNKSIRINDPACGDGALLKAMAESLVKKNISFSISGSDKDATSLSNTQNMLDSLFPNVSKELEHKDFIAERFDNLFSSVIENDIIIANPPYVRTQILGADYAQYISHLYKLSGRVDLYYPFLINMTHSLKPGGIIGVITSNRYLTTKSGASIRQFLYHNYNILEIIDLGDTKLFDAAVLPAIFIGRKKTSKTMDVQPLYRSVYQLHNWKESGSEETFESIYDLLNENKAGTFRINDKLYEVKNGTLKADRTGADVWQLKSGDNDELITTIETHAYGKVADFFKVRVGVKSCADDVFFTRNYTPIRPEDEWFRSLISQENIQKWLISDDLQEVIYPHFNASGKKDVLDIDKFPRAKAFFNTYEDRLKERKYLLKSKRKWYEYWVPQNATLWGLPKVVWADISSEPRFAYDHSDAIVNGNCYWICASNEEEENLLYLIMGIANSRLMEYYHDSKFNNKLYNGKRRYLSQYVEQYPLPDPSSEESQKIIILVKSLLCNKSQDNSTVTIELENAVRHSFGFKD